MCQSALKTWAHRSAWQWLKVMGQVRAKSVAGLLLRIWGLYISHWPPRTVGHGWSCVRVGAASQVASGSPLPWVCSKWAGTAPSWLHPPWRTPSLCPSSISPSGQRLVWRRPRAVLWLTSESLEGNTVDPGGGIWAFNLALRPDLPAGRGDRGGGW